jgi:large subunit ribosomal protein L23
MNAFEVIKTVRLTEKGTRQGSQMVRAFERDKTGKPVTDEKGKAKIKERPLNQYTVVADRRANKTEIRQAVEELFKANKVKVIKVNTLNVHGKQRRQRTSQAGKAPDWKKAIVTLREGDKIVLT